MICRAATTGRLLAGALVLLMAACSSGPERPKPKPLEPITAAIAGRQVWTERIGDVGFPLSVAVNAGVFTVASNDGTVAAVQADTGKTIWRTSVDGRIVAGVGSDGRFAAVVTREGDLVVLDGGKPAWRKPIGTKVVTAPLVAGERVFVLGVDRRVLAYDVLDGRMLWSLQRPGDALTLAQGGVIAAFKDTLLVGQGPRLAGIDPLRGSVRWEVPVASPRGANEVERLADLVAPLLRLGDTVCMRAFQSAVGCVNAERGNLLWSRTIGGTEGVAGNEQVIVGADASDRLTAWRTASGEVAWTSERLMYRSVSSPLAVGPTVVFVDGEGTVHWMSLDKGEPVLRLSTDSSGAAAAPVASGNTLLVVTRNGGLHAFRPE
ncbi:MAG TPA: outer membrane protein assembly factor BamB [Piscinibacter sp.]|uniref:outer membrane protein assembly factor BamB n=1 Tax=Piscinibacter sp. TaxID=1903157 RepID=UPI0025ECCD31|nr:outer membrane protein assembly factor BamB [Piscinibacter sp.]HOY34327.1 outer membrane protein assembly factor BamB [Piscinibacter sp.]HPG78163.1 outer membrane protein assembly factor BamB [Piscinibacter sp.]HPM65938.1 outer membrane protein assembly factor BamB [Piscinibacter sp.]